MVIPVISTYAQTGNEEQTIYKDDVNSIKLNKEVAESTNGEYMITLSSFVTGTRETHEALEKKPIDFTLVLDMSGSMGLAINDTEMFKHDNARLAPDCTYNNMAIYSPYGYSDDFGNCTQYYYKHNDGNLYPVKRFSSNWGGTVYYFGFTTAETVTHSVTGATIPKYYYLGGNRTSGYSAVHLSDTGSPCRYNGSGDPTDWSNYTLDWDYASRDPNSSIPLYIGPLYSRSRMAALWNGVKTFFETVYADDTEYMTDETGHHRVGVVKFATEYTSTIGNTYNYSQIVFPWTKIQDCLYYKDDIQNIAAGGWTRTDQGMRLAKEIKSKSTSDGKDRRNVVILFTDGLPAASTSQGMTNTAVANGAISYAKQLKAGGAEVYVMALVSNPSDFMLTSMEYISSDYPNATDMNNGGDKEFDKYLSFVRTGESMAAIFEAIGSNSSRTEIGYSLTESNQVVFDALTKHFLLPEDITSTDTHRIGVYTRDFRGIVDGAYNFDPTLKPLLGARVSLGGDNNREIIVSGFDFAENWCGLWRNFNWLGQMNDVWQGKELVIKIPIIVDPANPGGANMTTNEATSGIYNDDGTGHPDFSNPLKPFPIPEVSLPNIVVVKNGMKANNSAIFVVTRVNSDGTLDSTYEPFTVMAIADGTGTAKIRLKLVGEGRYKVSEQSWSWAYDSTPTATYAKDDGHTSVQGNTITRNVLGATADSTENGTLYIFTNTDRKNIPAHDEDAVNNVFFTPQVVIQ